MNDHFQLEIYTNQPEMNTVWSLIQDDQLDLEDQEDAIVHILPLSLNDYKEEQKPMATQTKSLHLQSSPNSYE